MKKLFSVLLTVALVAMLGAVVFAANPDTKFKAVNGTAVVDGVKDEIYTVADAIPVAVTDSGEMAGTAVVYAAWDDTNMYYFFEVTDPTVTPADLCTSDYLSDSVETYFSFAGYTDDITTINAGQYTVGPNFTAWAGRGGHWDAYNAESKWAFVMTDKGWDMEMSIPFGADYKVAAGNEIPFTIAFNDDSDGDAERNYQPMISEGQSNAWSVVDDPYNTLIFSDIKFAPMVEEAPAEAAPAAEAPAEEAPAAETVAEAPAAPAPAAQTGDSTWLLLMAGSGALVTPIVVYTTMKKKRK